MKFLHFIFLFFFVFGYTQNYSKDERAVLIQAKILDSLMQHNDFDIVNLFCTDVSFGHSNGWVQNLDDFKKDFYSKKVVYNEISQLEILELKHNKKTISLRRMVNVSGSYESNDFKMNLALLEIWIKKKSVWKLWSRQSMEIKP